MSQQLKFIDLFFIKNLLNAIQNMVQPFFCCVYLLEKFMCGTKAHAWQINHQYLIIINKILSKFVEVIRGSSISVDKYDKRKILVLTYVNCMNKLVIIVVFIFYLNILKINLTFLNIILNKKLLYYL